MTGVQFDNRRSVAIRLTVVQYVVAICFFALAVSFWIFQVAEHPKSRARAENNHLRALPLRAPRGVLFDRNGRVLVENRYSATISLVREQIKDLDATIRQLAAIARIPEKDIREAVNRR